MLTLKEAADRLSLSPEGMRLIIKAGHIKAMKAGHGRNSPWRIREEDLDAYIRQQYAQAAS